MNASGSDPKSLQASFCTLEEFVRKVEDEVYRAVRYDIAFSVVLAQLSFANDGGLAHLQQFIAAGLRQIDFASVMGDRIYVLGLPFTPRKGAQVVASRLRAALLDFSPLVGFATAPADGGNARELLGKAAADAASKRSRAA